jgi:hypothetical protein
MNKEKNTNQYWKQWQEIKLSDSSRVRMKQELDSYIKFHAAAEGVRVGTDGRSIRQVPQRTLLTSLRLTYMPFAILIAVMIGGGVSFAAGGAVPGDFLYPVKTEVNESVRSVFSVGADAEARLQAKLVEERLREAKELKAKGRLEGEVALTLAAKMKRNTERAQIALEKSIKSETQAEVNKIIIALTEYNATVDNQTSLVVGIGAFERIRVGGEFSSDLSMEVVSVADLRAQVNSRLSGLQSVIAEHRSELSAEVRAELETNLSNAETFAAEASAAVEADARRLLNNAADVLGRIESRLSTMGTVEINSATGAIIDIDFSRVPARNNNDNATGTNRSGANVEVEVDANATSNGSSLNTSGAIRGGLEI